MKDEEYRFVFKVYNGITELNPADAALLNEAIRAIEDAYAPYSNFKVGAAALLMDGTMVRGSNQENASYPVGICAERVLLSAVSSLHPGEVIQAIAITYFNTNGKSDRPVSPCGMCRQALVEYEKRMKHPIRLLFAGLEGEIFVVEQARMLLPFGFNADDMNISI